MTTLLVGFDSAWTRTKIGAIVGAVITAMAELQNSGHLAVRNSRTRLESSASGRQRTLRRQRWCFWTNRSSS